MLKRLPSALPLCLLAVTLVPPPAAALDLGQWVPGLKLSPFFSSKLEYDTNVFQTPNNAKDDFIFKQIPGFVADYTFGPHSLSAGYRAEILNYDHLTSQNTVNSIAVGQLRLDFPRLLLNFREDFVKTNTPPNTELTGPVISNTNTVKGDAEYRLTSRFSTGVNSSWQHVRYEESDIANQIDADYYTAGTSFYWKFVPKADLGLNFSYTRGSFTHSSDGNRDYNSYTLGFGLRGDVTPKLSSGLRFGYTWQVQDTDSNPGFTGLTFGGDLSYRPTERATITLSGDRSTQASTFGTVAFYVTTTGTLAVQYQLLPKLSIGGRVGGGVNDYSTKETVGTQTDWRKDTFLLGGLEATYDIQPWLRVGVDYLHLARYSNFAQFEFVEDRFTGRVTFQF